MIILAKKNAYMIDSNFTTVKHLENAFKYKPTQLFPLQF